MCLDSILARPTHTLWPFFALASALQVLEASGSVECLSYSPCGTFLASGDGGRNVYVYDASKDYERKMDRWKYHASKVVAMAWTSDSKHLATYVGVGFVGRLYNQGPDCFVSIFCPWTVLPCRSSLDTNVIIWNMDQEMKRTTIKAAHPLHDVTKVRGWGKSALARLCFPWGSI